MDAHFCSTCGTACTGPAVAETVEEVDDPGTVERALDTVDHALDVIETMVEEEEETERVEAVADATVDVVEAEADATVDVVEAVTEESSVEEVEEVPAVEPESTEDQPQDEETDETPDDDGEVSEEGEHAGNATPVEVPPQLNEDESRPQSSSRSTSAFRKRRMRR